MSDEDAGVVEAYARRFTFELWSWRNARCPSWREAGEAGVAYAVLLYDWSSAAGIDWEQLKAIR